MIKDRASDIVTIRILRHRLRLHHLVQVATTIPLGLAERSPGLDVLQVA